MEANLGKGAKGRWHRLSSLCTLASPNPPPPIPYRFLELVAQASRLCSYW